MRFGCIRTRDLTINSSRLVCYINRFSGL